ncbi:DUF7146 domain-containing protein [Rhodopseudomonas palustris]|uniref:DUF7146 domain-containing protein n=1 Tax=Rhodopseudomonas palustris TaxID=1076 RepID=UPI000CEB9B2E|nr:CHC2 zinc finger domain-containing protein [Rhodopseudomonas palustris]PPQ42147.1 hypothetical protein CKO39_18325 [Rhodopseudomonas palustris]
MSAALARRFSEADLAQIRERNPVADVAGQYVTLRRSGAKMIGPCPVCGGGAKSKSAFEVKVDGETWVCAVCSDGGDVIRLVEKIENCSFVDACERLGGQRSADAAAVARLAEQREAKRLKREADAERYREQERRRLRNMWDRAEPLRGTPAERYLTATRGLILPDKTPGLRFLPAAAYFHGEEEDERGRISRAVLHRGPAMIAAFIRGDGRFGGLHFTYFTDTDPPRKLELIDPATGETLPAKKMRGSKLGAHILFARESLRVCANPQTDPNVYQARVLVIGEGIETVGSVYTAHRIAGRSIDDYAWWAAGDLGNLGGPHLENLAHPTAKQPNGHPRRVPGPLPDLDKPGLVIPDSVEQLILLGDGDSDPVLTHYAMDRAARRYARPGLTIRIAFARAGGDFNGMLRGEA